MGKNFIIINQIHQVKKISRGDFDTKNFQIAAINSESHEELKSKRIEHEIYDNLISTRERDLLYEFTIKKYNWFNENDDSKNFSFNGLNLFEIMDTGALHEDLLKILIEGTIIKKIIEYEKPTTITCSNTIKKFIQKNFKEIKCNTLEVKTEQQLMYENVEIKFNLGKNPIAVKVSKNNYIKLKKYFEKITCSIYDLWYKKSSKEIILLTEFNPSSFKKFISTLGSKKYLIVFMNFRRPASWNMESINLLKTTGSKIINNHDFLSNEDIDQTTKNYRIQLEKIFDNENFNEIFKFQDIIYWPLINENFKKAFYERMPDYIKKTLIIKNILEKLNLRCFICLNETGETEKILLKINKNRKKSILLLHGFHNFHKETENIRMKYDLMRVNSLKSDRFFVWGEKDFEYYPKLGIEKSKIVITGSPKFDDFKIQKKSTKDKVILITPEPITELSGNKNTELSNMYENIIRKICDVIKSFNDVNIVVKLHPGQNQHNQILMRIFNQIDSSIPVYQLKSTEELINQCDMLLNITCESFDPSTIMLEGLILDKPVLEFSLDGNKYSISNNAIISTFDINNMKNHLQKILFDSEFQKINNEKRKQVLKNYLSYQSKSSEKILDYINNWD